MTTSGAIRCGLAALAVASVVGPRFAPSAAAVMGGPVVTVDSATGTVGSEVVVRLSGWPRGPVTVTVCGNKARRGSQDCALRDAQGISVNPLEVALLDLRVVEPPVPCPCVVRVATATSDVVRTAPIDIQGVAIGAPLEPAGGPASVDEVRVTARIETPDESWPASWIPAFGGSAPRELVVTVRNRSAETLEGLHVNAAVGRDRTNGEPLPRTAMPSIPAGKSRSVRLAFDLAAPAWGDYEVFGRVYGLDVPAPFGASTSNEPLGLEIVIPLALLGIARLIRRRERAAREVAEASVDLLQESSPGVGPTDDGRSETHAYDPARDGFAHHGNGNGTGGGQHAPMAEPMHS